MVPSERRATSTSCARVHRRAWKRWAGSRPSQSGSDEVKHVLESTTMRHPRILFALCTVVVVIAAAGLSPAAQSPPEPGATPGVLLTNISKNAPQFASVFPQVAVSRTNPKLVAVAWRRYNLPIDVHALKGDRVAECYVSVSRDGGQTFTEQNMMPLLRTAGGGGEPELWGCDAPWIAIASDGTM